MNIKLRFRAVQIQPQQRCRPFKSLLTTAQRCQIYVTSRTAQTYCRNVAKALLRQQAMLTGQYLYHIVAR